MRVHVPRVPALNLTTTPLEVLAIEHDYPPIDDLDEDSAELAESRLPEYAVLARRGWIFRFNTELEFSLDAYTKVVEQVLARAKIGTFKVEVVSEHFVVNTDVHQVVAPLDYINHEEDWLDIEFLAHICARVLEPHAFTLLVTMDSQLSVFAVVPTALWLAIEERELLEEFESVDVIND